MSGKVKQKKIPVKLLQIICYSIILIGIFISEIYWRTYLYDKSIDFIENFQSKVSKNVLEGLKYIRLLEYYPLLLFIILLVYNFSNIYKTFILISVLHNAWGISAILKMIYIAPRPYFDSDKISEYSIYGCEVGWGNPSSCAIVTTSFYLTLWRVLFVDDSIQSNNTSQTKKCGKTKIIMFIITIILILAIIGSTVITGSNSFNQILFGFVLGIAIYTLLFYIIEVNVYDNNQFLRFINFHSIWNIFIYFVVLISGAFLFYLRSYEVEDIWNDRINLDCSQISINLKFHDEALIQIFSYFSSIWAIAGIKSELRFSFQSNKKVWREFNFDVSNESYDSLLDPRQSIVIHYKTQWNHTNAVTSIIRVIVSIVLTAAILSPHFFISNNSDYVVVVFLKVFIPLSVFYYCLFFCYKIVFKFFKIVFIGMSS